MSGGAIKPSHNTIQNGSFSAYKPGTAGVTGPSIQTIGFIDVQSQPVPDAIQRIKMKNHQKAEQAVHRKKKLANQLESARSKVLQSYNIKTII